jgi:hypothetical protein
VLQLATPHVHVETVRVAFWVAVDRLTPEESAHDGTHESAERDERLGESVGETDGARR